MLTFYQAKLTVVHIKYTVIGVVEVFTSKWTSVTVLNEFLRSVFFNDLLVFQIH